MKPETSVKSLGEESGCDKKEEDILEEAMRAKNFTFNKLSERCYNVESTKYKMLEADATL